MKAMTRADMEKHVVPWWKAMMAVRAIFFLLYFVLGLFLLFSDKLPFVMSSSTKIFFGILLIAYSGFRLWRIAGSLAERGKV